MEKLKRADQVKKKYPAIERRHKGELFAWFHEKNRHVLKKFRIRTIWIMSSPDSAMQERRDFLNQPKSNLFTFKGDARSIDTLQSRLRLRTRSYRAPQKRACGSDTCGKSILGSGEVFNVLRKAVIFNPQMCASVYSISKGLKNINPD
jgi:hypothetical protein